MINESQVILRVSDISFSYTRDTEVLRHVSLDIHEGELITLLGPNGAGKSTLLNCMMAFLAPSSGEILLTGENVQQMSYRDISRLIAYVPQYSNVTFSHTVKEYIAMGRAPYLGLFSKPSKSDYELVDNALETMQITRLKNKSYSQLSGGERQLVDVCRAIVQQPKLILFDEPTSALDYSNQIRVLRLVKDLSSKGYSVLMTTHNPDHPLQLGGTVCVLSKSGTLKSGTVESTMQESYLNEIYNSKLKIRYFDEDDRKICISEKL